MNTFDSRKHPRGGHADNPGKFSVAELEEVALDDLDPSPVTLADLDGMNGAEASALNEAVLEAISSGNLSGDAFVRDEKIVFCHDDGSEYFVDSNSTSVWAWPVLGSEFEAEYFATTRANVADMTVKAIRSARTEQVSRAAWRESVLAYSALALVRGGVFVKNSTHTDDSFTVNHDDPFRRVRFSGFEASDQIHDDRASMSVALGDVDEDHSYVVTCNPQDRDLFVHRGFDNEPMPHWEAQGVYAQIHSRTGLDENALVDMLARPALAVAEADAPVAVSA